jgi:hypothetical protein
MTAPERWWKQATGDDAGKCRGSVVDFLDRPHPEDTEKCARALALYILLGGDDTAIRDRVDKLQESPQMVLVGDALAACEAKLSQANVAMPEELRKSHADLIVRDEKASARRLREILRKARTLKLKPRPK